LQVYDGIGVSMTRRPIDDLEGVAQEVLEQGPASVASEPTLTEILAVEVNHPERTDEERALSDWRARDIEEFGYPYSRAAWVEHFIRMKAIL
jgi:hypothetical protein